MSRLIKVLLILTLFVCTLCLIPHPAQAGGYWAHYAFTGPGTCDGSAFSVPGKFSFHFPPTPGTGRYVETVNGTQTFDSGTYSTLTGDIPITASNFSPSAAYSQASDYTWTRHLSFSFNGTVFSSWLLTVKCNLASGVATGTATDVTPGTSNAFFNPGDTRADPRPGDRLAVYCNTTGNPPNVTVYGIADDQPQGKDGFLLTVFNVADLLKAGAKGITNPVGSNLGSVSMMEDGAGHFYVAWNGGKYQATGQHDFSKSFTCDFSK